MGDTIDLFTFFHKIQAEYPNCVVLKADERSEDGGTVARLVVKEEYSPDHQHIECTIADDVTLTLGLGQYITWKYVKEEHVQQAIRYAFTWLNRYLPAEKIVEGSERSKKIDYEKMAFPWFCPKVFAHAKSLADVLEYNKEYLLNFFCEMELSQGIAFLLKLDKMIH